MISVAKDFRNESTAEDLPWARGCTKGMKVIIAFIVNIIFNFVIGLLVAKFLGPAEYGRFALAFATAEVVQLAFFDWA